LFDLINGIRLKKRFKDLKESIKKNDSTPATTNQNLIEKPGRIWGILVLVAAIFFMIGFGLFIKLFKKNRLEDL
jgi:hypothetical protein